MAGHANKAYWRVRGPEPVVVMAIAPDAGPEEISDHHPAGAGPWLEIQRYLAGIGVPVPAVRGWHERGGYVVLKDLGDRLLLDDLHAAADPEPLLQAAIDLLADCQLRAARRPDPGCLAFQRRFGESLWRLEVEHILEWGFAGPLSPGPRATIVAGLAAMGERVLRLPAVFSHRDFHSRNLIVGADGALRVIDFQDALLGPPLYDLVSLLRDSYFELEWTMVQRLGRYYGDRLEVPADDAFWESFDLLTIQRKLKDAARFVYLDRVRGNPDFRRYQARAVRYARDAFDRRGTWAGVREALFPG